jgi:hypothetical protein
MIRRSRERPFGELELLIKPTEKKNSLEQSLQILRSDLSSKRLIEQYDVSTVLFLEHTKLQLHVRESHGRDDLLVDSFKLIFRRKSKRTSRSSPQVSLFLL